MDDSPAKMRPVLQRPAAGQVALATIAPLAVAIFSTSATLIIGEQYGMGAVPFVLVGWCVILLGFAAWLNQVLFHSLKSFLPFLAAVGVILATWLWQRRAFTVLIPHGDLGYGYFLHPEGAKARFWVLVCPFWVGFVCLLVCCIVVLILGWRAGAHYSLACLAPWWLAAFIVFALPSLYLDGQGNASIFI